MNISQRTNGCFRLSIGMASFAVVVGAAFAAPNTETEKRVSIAAASMEDALVVDCQLPGKLRKLGGTRQYLTPGRLVRSAAVECRTRGGEYTLGDLASGTLSLNRWLVPANDGDAEAQYYVARIYANGMDNVPIDFSKAAEWYDKAAVQGYSEAKQELGYLYEQGLGVEQDLLLALNLQREASGFGEDLDFAWKVDEAEKIQATLARQLELANDALNNARLDLRTVQTQLAAERDNVRRRENELTALIADLNSLRQQKSSASSGEVEELEAELAQSRAQLAERFDVIAALEAERNSAQSNLQTQMTGSQATNLELRELLAVSRGETESLRGKLAGETQRLIRTEEELIDLQAAFREQAETMAAEREQLFQARSRTESDAAAYLAARESEIAAQASRIENLEAQLKRTEAALANASDTGQQDLLQLQFESMQVRYETEIARQRTERQRLEADHARGTVELNNLFAASKDRIAQKEVALQARKREIETLRSEATQLRERVGRLEVEQREQAIASGEVVKESELKLADSRQQVLTLQGALSQLQADKASSQVKLSKTRLELQQQLAAGTAASQDEIVLLKAEITAGESTIKAQNLRISALEKRVSARDAELADLRDEYGESTPLPVEVQNAMTVLDMARSRREPNLGNYYALLIANERYENLPVLKTPVRDALEVERLLKTRYGFETELLANATQDDVMRKLHDYRGSLTENDNLLIYYSGRGSTPDGPPDRAYWLGVDADPKYQHTWLLAEYVSDKIREIPAKRILVVSDSCFSIRRARSQSMTVGRRGLNPKRFELLAKNRARTVLTSGANVPVLDENGDQIHSTFAKYFLEVLRQNNNVLSGEMLSHELSYRVQERLQNPEKAIPAYSSLQGAGHGNGDFFFVPLLESLLVADAT